MCGIIGGIEFSNRNTFDFSKGGFLHRYISGRGPDFYSLESKAIEQYNVTLAHSRLAIIDLSNDSNQPMESLDGRYLLTYNGEIYNYLELRSELIDLEVQFKTKGDTEVLLKAWEHWGIECLNKLNGMFAFSILDSHKRELFLVRDRFGVKPLLYGFLPNGNLLFSSSISAVAKYVGDEIDLEYCSNGIHFGFFEGFKDSSPFKNVKYILPGSYIKYKLGEGIEIEKTTWYSLNEAVENKVLELSKFNSSQLIEMGKCILEDSLKLRLRSDVPLAVSLSGGVDSSIIAALANKGVENLVGFSYGSPGAIKSEGPIVESFANEKGIKVVYIYPHYSTQQMGDLLDKTFAAQEAPFLGLSVMAQNEVYNEVNKQNFKVLLGGQGGDEIFAGYRKFFYTALLSSLKDGDGLRSLKMFYSFGVFLLSGIQSYPQLWQQRNRYLNKKGNKVQAINHLPSVSADLFGDTSLQKRQILDVQNYSLPSLLRYEDRNSMSYSIESRLPFMDYRLVEFAIALKDVLKIKNGYNKWILREMMKNEVPNYILKNQVKRGFDVTQNWINEGIGNRLKSNLLDNKDKINNYVDDFNFLENSLTNEALSSDSNLFNEMMLLNFLATPINSPIN
jgi:asparagine synthase (glutamine-hydrolysing)